MKQRFCITFVESRKNLVMAALKDFIMDLECPLFKDSDAYMATIYATESEWKKIRQTLVAC